MTEKNDKSMRKNSPNWTWEVKEGDLLSHDQEGSVMDTQPRSAYSITFVIIMDLAFKLLTDGLLTVDEFCGFLDEMNEKYDSEEVRVLYQSKLDIYLEQSVNGDTKELINGNN